jgi:hypothetical protein
MQPITQDVFSADFLHREQDFKDLLLSMLKGGLSKKARDEVGAVAASYISRRLTKHGVTVDPTAVPAWGQTAVNALNQRGYADVPPAFSTDEMTDLAAYFEDKPVSYFINGHDGTDGRGTALLKDLPKNSRFAYFLSEDIYRHPAVYRIVNDAALIQTVACYLQAPPTVSTVSVWWSYPSPVKTGGMQLYHHDRGDFRSCNLFVYLTDVSLTSGPHAFVPYTHNYDVLLKWSARRFGKDPATFQAFWQWMDRHRKEDREIDVFFPKDQQHKFVGPRGTSFLEDTRGLHKGTAPEIEPRLVFEIVFSTLPKYNEPHIPVARSALPFRAEPAAISPLVRYATRGIYA